MPSIVQFIHPGKEHGPDEKNSNYKNWNHKEHRRKFLQSQGLYIAEGMSEPKPEKLIFWGEWEPPTKIEKLIPNENKFYPHWLHSRIDKDTVPEFFGGLQNTDPYVFDGPFRYFLCHQSKDMSPTSLSKLDNESLIMFGSNCLENKKEDIWSFQVDTIFVVKRSNKYDASSDNLELFKKEATEEYYNKSYLRGFPNRMYYSLVLRLYEGVTYEDRKDFSDMYSFVPCMKYDKSQGFPRIKLRSENFKAEFQEHKDCNHGKKFKENTTFISNKLNTNFKETKNVDKRIIYKVWQKIVGESRSNGCFEGVNFIR